MARKGGGFTAPSKGTEKSSNSLGASVSIADYGDVEVKGVIDVELSPLAGDINYDASENDLSVSGEIGLPGGVVGVGGGAIIDLDTGEIIGGSGSLGFGGAEVEVSISKCERTLQITYWGVGFAVSEDTCNNDEEPDPDPDPDPGSPDPMPPKPDPNLVPALPALVAFGSNRYYYFREEDGDVYRRKNRLRTNLQSFKLIEGLFVPNEKISVDVVDIKYSSNNQDFSIASYYRSGKWDSVRQINQFTWGQWIFRPGYTIRYANPATFNSQYPQASTNAPIKLAQISNLKAYFSDNVYFSLDYFETGTNYDNSRTSNQFFPCSWIILDINYNDIADSKKRRPLPPEIMDRQCCDASISLLRKIAKVLAVEQLLEEDEKKKISTDTIQTFKLEYDELTKQLALINKKPKIIFENHLQLKIYDLAIGNKKIDNIHNVLRAEDILEKGMKIPNELIVPGGSGETIVNDYANILKKFVQIIDLNTIQPFTAVLNDSDPAKEGNQTLTKFYPDATSAIKEVVELLLENKVDSATRLNIQMRQSVLGIETQVALLETLSIAYTILYGLGLPFHQKGSTFVAPFDVSPNPPQEQEEAKKKGKKGKGFNPKNKEEERLRQSALNSLNENREDATEKLLPDFLKTVNQEYLHTYFNDNEGKNESLWFYIMSVLMKL